MRTPLPPLAVVLSFIDRINRTDLDGLCALMTDDHALCVLDEAPVVGRAANRDAWRGYMTSFPEYVIYPEQFAVDGNRVAVLGRTTGSHLGLPDEQELKLTIIWVARVEGDQLAAWEIQDDTAENRRALGLT
jgi:ketosteroid isomerase-like protein